MPNFQRSPILHGSHIHAKRMKSSYTPMTDKCQTIIKIKQPKSMKECRWCCRKIKFMSSFLKDLRKHLIPIWDTMRFYDTYIRAFKDFLSVVDKLSNARLIYNITDLSTRNRYLRLMSNGLKKTSPSYQLVFQHTYSSYTRLSFTKSVDKLLVQIPNLPKHVLQIPLLLYSV